MMDQGLVSQLRHLYEVERLSMRQISLRLGISRRRVSRVIRNEGMSRPKRDSILKPYERLIEHWYKEYPSLKATQVYERLKGYGYGGSYEMVCIWTRRFRNKVRQSYHELDFLPGEEAQIDWMQWQFPFGRVYGFVFVLAYSRYLYLRFYPQQSLEFFLDGHMGAFREISGVVHRCRYDNLRSVVIQRRPELRLNAQFLDFSRHYGFSISLCNPYRANEKGRVERVIRDIKQFLGVNHFEDIDDLNKRVSLWRVERNRRIHRSTGKAPEEALREERLLSLPALPYQAYRVVMAQIGKTSFVEFETNRYSVPSIYCQMPCEVLAYPDHIEILIRGKKVASHKRSFDRRARIEDPSHREVLLRRTPNFKLQRIYELMRKMDRSVEEFLRGAEAEGQEPIKLSYELFKLLRVGSRATLLSAIREANGLKIYRIHYIQSLLRIPEPGKHDPVFPQDQRLLEIHYQGRELKDYDELI